MVSNATIEAARNGDRQAFRAIVDAFREPLFRYAHRLLGNATDAEDVFQETCVRVFMNLKQFQPGGNFRAWVYRITTNLCLDKKREANRPVPARPDSTVNPDLESAVRAASETTRPKRFFPMASAAHVGPFGSPRTQQTQTAKPRSIGIS